ncbi:MAG: hypothetical protein K1X64_11485 [Myxococcaceae bacterium]|nr:hypothetical protein [Myxococcaceae bacterium]
MPLEQAFLDDSPYAPEGMLLDDIVEVDKAKSVVVAAMTVHEDMPITRTQRVHPVRHPRHLSGGLMVHLTGILGLAHAYYVLGLRHQQGWIGYGARIHHARFHALAKPGAKLLLKVAATHVRPGNTKVLGRYSFEFKEGDTLVYEGDQTALWTRVEG